MTKKLSEMTREEKIRTVVSDIHDQYFDDPWEAREFLMELYAGTAQETFPVSEWTNESLDNQLKMMAEEENDDPKIEVMDEEAVVEADENMIEPVIWEA